MAMTQGGGRKKKKRPRQSSSTVGPLAVTDGGTNVQQVRAPVNRSRASISRREPLGEPAGPNMRPSEQVNTKTDAASSQPVERWDWRTIIVGASVSLAVFVLYILTAARDLIAGDTPEL